MVQVAGCGPVGGGGGRRARALDADPPPPRMWQESWRESADGPLPPPPPPPPWGSALCTAGLVQQHRPETNQYPLPSPVSQPADVIIYVGVQGPPPPPTPPPPRSKTLLGDPPPPPGRPPEPTPTPNVAGKWERFAPRWWPVDKKRQQATQAPSKTDENLKHIVSTACKPGLSEYTPHMNIRPPFVTLSGHK